MSVVKRKYSVSVAESDFDVADEYQKLCNQAPKSGAVVFFVGLVRDLYGTPSPAPVVGKNVSEEGSCDRVTHLELHHYEGMTESLCSQIIEKADQRFPIDGARVIHRVGKLSAGDQIVMVAVASRHRANAFSAAEYIMDYLKTQATLWKKEVGSRGEQWLGIKDKDKKAAQRWLNNN